MKTLTPRFAVEVGELARFPIRVSGRFGRPERPDPTTCPSAERVALPSCCRIGARPSLGRSPGANDPGEFADHGCTIDP